MVSVIIPTLNEEEAIGNTLESILACAGDKEVIVADGGSTDRTRVVAAKAGVRVVQCPRGRGQQMGAAAASASGSILWFVHADVRVPVEAIAAIQAACRDPRVTGGNFALEFSGVSKSVKYQNAIAKYSRFTGICYGDSGIFITRKAYEALGGIRPISLFEDVDLVRRMRRAGRFVHLRLAVTASARRFEGQWLRVWTQWTILQVLYWMGVPPERLALWYRPVTRRK